MSVRLFAGTTVRTRLTLWNVSILALVLIILGGSLRYLVRVNLLAGIDSELKERAHGFAVGWKEHSEKGPPRFPGSRGRGRDDGDRGRPRFLSLTETPGDSSDKPLDKQALDRVRADRQEHYSTITVDNDIYRIFSLPLRDRQTQLKGVCQMPFRLTDIERGFSALDATLMALFPIALIVAGIGGAFLTDRALRPVRHITQATDQIEAQNLSGRLSVTGRDEFSDLALRFNRMLERLETAFERQRRFTADASHELRTPLSIIKASTSLALDDDAKSTDAYRKTLRSIDSAADRMSRIVQDLLFLARSDAGQLPLSQNLISVDSVLQRVIETLPEHGDHADEPRVTLEITNESLCVRGDIHHLSRALGNLVENALRHTPPDGVVSLSVQAVADPALVLITVQDTGEGIAPEYLPRLFERFYRADEGRARPRGSTGLGLAIVKTIIESHGGAIGIQSTVGQGTTVTVTLPAA